MEIRGEFADPTRGRLPADVREASSSTAESVEVPVVDVAVSVSDPVARLGVVSILSGEAHLRVVDDLSGAGFDVLLVVEDEVDETVFARMRELRARNSVESARCVLVTDHFRPDRLLRALEFGCAAILRRAGLSGGEIVRTVVAVSNGDVCLPPTLQGELVRGLERVRRDVLEPNGLTMTGLTARERDILRQLADGHSINEIAAVTGCSGPTVRTMLRDLMNRYGVTTRAQAVAHALRTGDI